MWKLTSNTLPTEKSKRVGAPIANLWAVETLAPVCRLAVGGESFPTPIPEAIGNYYYLKLPDADIEITKVGNLDLAWIPKLNSYWFSVEEFRAISTSPVTLSAIATVGVPIPVNYLYEIDLSSWGNISITGVSSEGMKFFPAVDPLNLQHPEWKFENSILSFQGEDICAPRIGGDVEISFDLIIDTPLYKVSKFQFSDTINNCELIEYLGFRYQVTINRFPTNNQFIWDYANHCAYVFS